MSVNGAKSDESGNVQLGDDVVQYKSLSSLQSVAGTFWFDYKSGIPEEDWPTSGDWAGLQIGPKNGHDKSQFIFNGYEVFFRYDDNTLGNETWTKDSWIKYSIKDLAQDSAVVHKAIDEEIPSIKTFKKVIRNEVSNNVMEVYHPDMDGLVVPSQNFFNVIGFYDKNKVRQGFIQLSDRTNGNLELEIVINNGSDTPTKDSRLKIGYNKNTKTFYTSVPTPADSASGNEILNAEWGNKSFFRLDGSNYYTGESFNWKTPTKTYPAFTVVEGASDGAAFFVSGMGGITAIGSGESCASFKTHLEEEGFAPTNEQLFLLSDNGIYLVTDANNWANRKIARIHSNGYAKRGENTVKGETASANVYMNMMLCEAGGEATGNRFGGYEVTRYTDKSVVAQMKVYGLEAGSSAFDEISIKRNADGSVTTKAPHPITDSNDNSIATTKWTRDLVGSAVPVGAQLPFSGKTVPKGYLFCNGMEVSRTTYAALFAVIGTDWGAGDGSTTFNLPDGRGKHFQGASSDDEVGTYLEAGLPNITGRHGGHAYKSDDHMDQEGAFYGMDTMHGGAGSTTNCNVWNIGFDASISSPIYGASETVQTPSQVGQWIIKI